MLNYTSGNWTVSDDYTDTVTATKSLVIPDLDFKIDYSKKEDEPASASIVNTTSSGLNPSETVKFGYSSVANIYTNTDVDAASYAPSKRGVQVMAEITENYKAVNSVTGDEVILPCKGRVVLRFPSMSCVSTQLIHDLFVRSVSAALNTGLTDATRIVEMAKGSLLPSGL